MKKILLLLTFLFLFNIEAHARFGFGKPTRAPSDTTAPAKCVIGDIFWDSDADTDGELQVCKGSNTFKTVGSGTTITFDTVANLPGSPSTNDLAGVTDGADASDCIVGGGGNRNLCIWNGATWLIVGDGDSGAGGGESNTASNTGTVGTGVFKQKVGVDLEFYKLNTTTDDITLSLNGTDRIDFTFVPGNVASTELSDTADILYETELDTFSELDTQIADQTLVHSGSNIATATAFAANPTDCAANQFADAIAANGNLTCNAIVDADVPNTITVDLATAATALAANGANCPAGSYALGVDASGAAESCTDATTEIDSAISTHAGNAGAHHTPTVDTNLTQEEVEDFAGGMVANVTGTHTRISITYQDATGDMDFVVDDMNDDIPESGDFGNAADLEATGALSVNVVAPAEMADADHGDVSWTAGVATVENLQCTDCLTPTDIDETQDYSFTTVSGKQDRNDTAVDDDSCVGEQGLWWYDTTDSQFEFCNANSGAPAAIPTTPGDVTDVFNCASGDCNGITVETGESLSVDPSGEVEATENIISFNNDSGATLFACTAVYISGFDIPSNLVELSIADADNSAQMPAIGIIEDDVANGANGKVILMGTSQSWDTNTAEGWSVGDALFVNDSGTSTDDDCGNTLTNVRPANTDDNIQRIGTVVRVHATSGQITVSGANRSNDVPNLADATLWVGNGSNVATPVSMSNDATMANTGVLTFGDDVVDFDHITDSMTMDASTSITAAANTWTLTSATDGWGGMTISNTTADLLASTTLLSLIYTDNGDADGIFLKLLDGASNDLFKINSNGEFLWEGTTADAFELKLVAVDPTTDVNITFPAGNSLDFTNGFDPDGAIDIDYGSADITDHTFITDGTGTAEIVLPAGSIDGTEILDDTITDDDISNSADVMSGAFGITINGGGSAITTGVKGSVEVPYAMTINQATFLCDQSGSIVVDVWKDTYANYPPTNADSITAAAPPTITAATKSQDTTLTGWTTSVTAGDIVGFNVDSASTVTRCHLLISGNKT